MPRNPQIAIRSFRLGGFTHWLLLGFRPLLLEFRIAARRLRRLGSLVRAVLQADPSAIGTGRQSLLRPTALAPTQVVDSLWRCPPSHGAHRLGDIDLSEWVGAGSPAFQRSARRSGKRSALHHYQD